jgi:hypothetical protein
MNKNLKHAMRDRPHKSGGRIYNPHDRRAQPVKKIGLPAFDAVAFAAVLEVLG